MQNDNDDDDKPSCGVTPATQSTPQSEWRRFRDEKRKYFWEMRKHRDHSRRPPNVKSIFLTPKIGDSSSCSCSVTISNG